MMYVSGRSEYAFIEHPPSLSFLFQTTHKAAGVHTPAALCFCQQNVFPYDYKKSPRQSFSAYRRENKLQSVFSGDMCTGKNTSQPASVESGRPLTRFCMQRAASPSRKCKHFRECRSQFLLKRFVLYPSLPHGGLL